MPWTRTPPSPSASRRSRNAWRSAGSWSGNRQARGLWTNSWTASAPISSHRSSARLTPPEQWAPRITRLRYADAGSRPHGTEPDGLPPHRERPHGALQLAVRAPRGRRVPAADREHGHESRGRRGGRADPGVAALARARLGRAGDVPARPDRTLPGRGAPPRRGRKGVRGRGRDPDPDAGRGRDGVGRPDPRPDRGAEREARGPRRDPLRRPPDLQLRIADRGLARRDHPRAPRRGPHLEHAEADQDPRRARRAAAELRASVA